MLSTLITFYYLPFRKMAPNLGQDFNIIFGQCRVSCLTCKIPLSNLGEFEHHFAKVVNEEAVILKCNFEDSKSCISDLQNSGELLDQIKEEAEDEAILNIIPDDIGLPDNALCEVCDNVFDTENEFQSHSCIPTCEVCGKAFDQWKKLRIHKKTCKETKLSTQTCQYCRETL